MRIFALVLQILILLAAVANGSGAHSLQKADELPKSFEAAASAAADVQAIDGHFEQLRTSLLFAEPQHSTGRFTWRKPDTLRWSYDGLGAFLSVDGKSYWLGDDGQAKPVDLPVGGAIAKTLTALLTFDGQLIAKSFKVVELGPTRFELAPRGVSSLPYTRIELDLDPLSGLARSVRLDEKSGDSTTITFVDLAKNPALPPDLLKPPKSPKSPK